MMRVAVFTSHTYRWLIQDYAHCQSGRTSRLIFNYFVVVLLFQLYRLEYLIIKN